jgi:hypothetical protein
MGVAPPKLFHAIVVMGAAFGAGCSTSDESSSNSSDARAGDLGPTPSDTIETSFDSVVADGESSGDGDVGVVDGLDGAPDSAVDGEVGCGNPCNVPDADANGTICECLCTPGWMGSCWDGVCFKCFI